MQILLKSKAQGRKWHWKSSKPCHVGIHWKTLAKYSQMSTHVPGFQSFFRFHNFVLAKLAASIIRAIQVQVLFRYTLCMSALSFLVIPITYLHNRSFPLLIYPLVVAWFSRCKHTQLCIEMLTRDPCLSISRLSYSSHAQIQTQIKVHFDKQQFWHCY